MPIARVLGLRPHDIMNAYTTAYYSAVLNVQFIFIAYHDDNVMYTRCMCKLAGKKDATTSINLKH